MTTFPATYTPTPDPHDPHTCARLGGCLGSTSCDYCGKPMPVRHDARHALTRLIEQLRRGTGRTA